MSKKVYPPSCYICHKNFEKSLDKLYYCICDVAVCSDCIHSVTTGKDKWKCPKCNHENNLKGTKLIREK